MTDRGESVDEDHTFSADDQRALGTDPDQGAGADQSMGKVLWLVAIADLVILLLGIASLQVSNYYTTDRNLSGHQKFFSHIGFSGIAWAYSAIGLITFFGVLAASRKITRDYEQERRLRISITAAFMAVYFSVLGTLVFFHENSSDKGSFPYANTVLTNFTALMVVIIGFFFGASAYAESRRPPEKK